MHTHMHTYRQNTLQTLFKYMQRDINMMTYLKKIINIDQLPKCEVCKPLSVHLHPTGACASAMCRVEFAALFIVPSLLTLAVCVPSNRETNSLDKVTASD